MNPLQFINHITSKIKFLKAGTALYRPIKNISSELNVKAKYCPQWIPIESIPDLLKSDFTKIINKLSWYYKTLYNIKV